MVGTTTAAQTAPLTNIGSTTMTVTGGAITGDSAWAAGHAARQRNPIPRAGRNEEVS